MPDRTEAQAARLDERLVEKLLEAIPNDLKEASQARRRGYEAQERTEPEVIGSIHRLTAGG